MAKTFVYMHHSLKNTFQIWKFINWTYEPNASSKTIVAQKNSVHSSMMMLLTFASM